MNYKNIEKRMEHLTDKFNAFKNKLKEIKKHDDKLNSIEMFEMKDILDMNNFWFKITSKNLDTDIKRLNKILNKKEIKNG